MSTEENKARVRRLMEAAYNQGKLEPLDEVLDPEFVCYDPNSEAGEVRGAENIRRGVVLLRNAFPDLTITIQDQIAEGDKVVTRCTFTGTHEGEFFGLPPTGKRLEMSGIYIDRFEGDRLVEEWPEYDLLGAMKQLGAIPEAEQVGSQP
jgi:steroid delta-isomerase-like uncharacterized protein